MMERARLQSVTTPSSRVALSLLILITPTHTTWIFLERGHYFNPSTVVIPGMGKRILPTGYRRRCPPEKSFSYINRLPSNFRERQISDNTFKRPAWKWMSSQKITVSYSNG